jgi:hypothetical protein
VGSFFVIHPLKMVLFECKELGIGLLMRIEKVIEDVFFVLVNFAVEEDGSVASLT